MKIIEDKKPYFEVYIIYLNEDGDGVGKKNGFTWFVEKALPGDRVQCHAMKVNKSFGRAVATRLIEPSEYRDEAPCPYFEDCGGCQIQNMAYDAQLRFKRTWVEAAVQRIGGFADVTVKDTLGMADPFRFRNKGAYAVSEVDKAPVIGFYKRHSHDLVDVADCLVQDAGHASIIDAFKTYMKAFKVSGYRSKAKEGLVRHLVIRTSNKTGEVMVIVVTSKRKLPMTQKMVELLRAANPKIVSVVQNIQPEHTSEILGIDYKHLYGKAFIEDEMGALSFQISPASFYQVNTPQAVRLYESALLAAELTGKEVVFDLYSGTGSLSLFLAQKAKALYGVELNADAVADAEKNAAANGMAHVQFEVGLSELVAPRLYSEGIRADVVVVDPPRSGCEGAVLECIRDMGPKRVVYVSCKASTMARDLKILCEDEAYTIDWIQPVDLFGHTTGVEVVAALKRRDE